MYMHEDLEIVTEDDKTEDEHVHDDDENVGVNKNEDDDEIEWNNETEVKTTQKYSKCQHTIWRLISLKYPIVIMEVTFVYIFLNETSVQIA